MQPDESNGDVGPLTDGLLRWVRGVNGDFAASPTVSTVLRSVVSRGQVLLGVIGAVVWVLRQQRLVLAGAHGYEEGAVNGFEAVPLAAVLPLTDAVRTSMPVYLGSLEATRELYPSILGLDPAVVALAAVPLDRGGETVGVLGLSFDRRVDFTAEVRSALEASAAICTASLGVSDHDPRRRDADETLVTRVAELEREMAAMRELLRFIGDIAQRQLG